MRPFFECRLLNFLRPPFAAVVVVDVVVAVVVVFGVDVDADVDAEANADDVDESRRWSAPFIRDIFLLSRPL